MKIIVLIATLVLSNLSFSQKSYYFENPLSPSNEKITHVSEKCFGSYIGNTGTLTYEVNADGIFVKSTSISSISRETIRESSQYKVRNGFIHGVIKNDSLPCVLDDDRYYFGINNKDVLIGAGSLNILSPLDDYGRAYLINTYDNGNYIPMRLEFAMGKLTISYFDYEFDTKLFRFISDKRSINTGGTELVILNPDEKEIKKLLDKEIFEGPTVLMKN